MATLPCFYTFALQNAKKMPNASFLERFCVFVREQEHTQKSSAASSGENGTIDLVGVCVSVCVTNWGWVGAVVWEDMHAGIHLLQPNMRVLPATAPGGLAL
jgi:hypothetical protein